LTTRALAVNLYSERVLAATPLRGRKGLNMRLWSVHPKYLDTKGLVALWREGLLAQACLLGHTKGYTNHPQLQRFKETEDPASAIGTYLFYVWQEALKRGYKFDKDKIAYTGHGDLTVNSGQVIYELEHLKGKLEERDPMTLHRLVNARALMLHPMFKAVSGPVETWEKVA